MQIGGRELTLKKIIERLLYPISVVVNSIEFLIQTPMNLGTKLTILRKFYAIQWSPHMRCGHRFGELLYICQMVIKTWDERGRKGGGVIVEAGCWQGASTAKLAIVAELISWKLFVFDSFEGLPQPADEDERFFKKGDYTARLDLVKHNVAKYANVDEITFTPGFFENTLPNFKEQIDLVFVDVDIASSTRTCIQWLFPQMKPNSYFFSHDSNLAAISRVFSDRSWWKTTLNMEPRQLIGADTGLGLGRDLLGYIVH